ncbi:MAG: MurR/RpiR family transcriptional regulator [Actinomycetota bacterium]
MTDLAVRIERGYAELSPQEQRAADFMRDHLDDLAVYNATEVASLSGVSKATVSRLYRRLGFASAEQLRDHVRGLRGAPRPLAGTDFDAHLDNEIANLRSALAGLSLDAPARLIAQARRVLVIGFRNSYPMALHLRQQLAQARDGVELAPLPGQSIAEELASLDPEDVVVLLGFRRRPASFATLVAALDGIPTILLSDPSGRRYAGAVAHHIECPIDSGAAFDSYAAAASVVSLLASAVLEMRSRVADVSARFAALDELEG